MRRVLPPLVLSLVSFAAGCGSSEPGSAPQPGSDAYVPTIEVGGDDGAPPGETGPSEDASPDATSSIPTRSCETDFSFAPGASVSKVEVAGEWDDFVGRTPLFESGGTWRGELDLSPGDYAYKLVVNGDDWRLDPAHGRRKYVGGVENSRVIVEDCKTPKLEVKSFSAKGDGTVSIVVQYVDGAEANGVDPARVTVTADKSLPKAPTATWDAATGTSTLALTGLAKGKYTFTFAAKDATGRAAKPLHVPTWIEDVPFQWNDGPMYFVFTDRFRNGSAANDAPVAGVDARANYQGGDFAGVTKAIEEGYFDALGVRSLWLSPVNANTTKKGKGADGRDYSGYHGYWPVEARDTDPRFGTLAELKALTHAAHQHGIRVLLDLVQNQVHQDHAYVTAHSSEGWFNGDGSCVCGGPGCSWDDRPVDCWFTSYLPDVNWTNTATQDAFVEDSLWWLLEADADGFRVDAVKHMNDVASTALRTEIRERLEHGNARYYLVGETFTGGDDGGRGLIRKYVGPNALWGQFDFPLFWSIDHAYAQHGGNMRDLDAAVQKSLSGYGPDALMSPFLGNHDVTRFLSRAAGNIWSDPTNQAWASPPPAPDSDDPYDRMFLAFAFLMGQPGVPLIYNGDEVGTPGTADPDNRRFLKAEASLSAREKRLLDRVRVVAHARGTHPGLRRGKYTTLLPTPTQDDGDGYVFARGEGEDAAIVAINRGSTNRVVNVAIPAGVGVADGTVLKDLLGGPSVTVTGGAIAVPFTAKGASLFVK